MTDATNNNEHPSEIGPYKILDVLGEGGMSMVYLAEQTEPMKRRVALKILKAGMDTRQILARFDSERQALAVLDHSNIAKVFDGGVAASGRPYFVMERVHGIPITEYCDDNRLTIRARLKLFTDVCAAVQHAHLKGLVHRDLKPSNILVGVVDGKPLPKIIDFGIAKATSTPLIDETAHTRIGQIVGTPQYMSPEQASLTGVDVDSRTDIFSLGIVLYEMLAGAVPTDAAASENASLDTDHPKPSTRFTGLGETGPEIAKTRGTDPDDLRRLLRGDLDWIVMRAIENDRTRRYETVNALAMDCQRYLTHKPVLARPPSAAYLLSRFVRRNRLAVGATLIAVLAIIGGATAVAFGYIRATEAEQLAVQEAETASQVSDFLVDLFEVSDPSEARGNSVTAREVLARGSASIARELKGQPQVQATLMLTMGDVYQNLGLITEAVQLVEDALDIRRTMFPDNRVDLADALYAMTTVKVAAGDYDKAQEYGVESLQILTEVWGDVHEDIGHVLGTLATLAYYRSEYELSLDLFRQSFDVFEQTLGEEHPDVINTLTSLGSLYWRTGDLAEAERTMRVALDRKIRAVGEDHPETAILYNNVAILVKDRGDFDAAEPLYLRALDIQQKTLGEHPNVANTMNNIGMFYLAKGELDNAEPMFFNALSMWSQALGEENVKVLTAKHNLGQLYVDKREPEFSRRYLSEALAGRRKLFGDEHEDTASSMMFLADTNNLEGRYDEGRRSAQDALAVYKHVLPEDHALIAAAKIRFGDSLVGLEQFGEAEALMLASYSLLAESAPNSLNTRRARESMARLYDAWGKPQQAAEYR